VRRPTQSRQPSAAQLPAGADNQQFHSVKAIAGRLGVSEKTVRRLIERDELVGHNIGRSVRISEANLQSFLQKNRKDLE
jgi:excisionase family DNA binding protein